MLPQAEAQTSWKNILISYDDFEQHSGWEHIKPFRQFVAQLAASPFASFLFASPSHEVLCITSVAAYPEKFKKPFVAVYPRKNGIKAEYWAKQHKRLEKAEGSLEAAWDIVKPMLVKLADSSESGKIYK